MILKKCSIVGSCEINVVSLEAIQAVILTRLPLGLFLSREGVHWVAVDNADGNAWTESFYSEGTAERWLRGEIELSQ